MRFASLDDIEELIKVRFDYFSAEQWEVTPEQHEIIENNLRQYYTKYLNTDFFSAFTEIDNEIVSVAFLAISHMPANLSFTTGKTGTILNVLTYPEHRRKGYATKTLNLLLNEVKKQNLSYVKLSASESGKPLYEKLGFKESTKSQHLSHYTEMKLLI